MVWFGGWVVFHLLPGIKHVEALSLYSSYTGPLSGSGFSSTFILISQNHASRVNEKRPSRWKPAERVMREDQDALRKLTETLRLKYCPLVEMKATAAGLQSCGKIWQGADHSRPFASPGQWSARDVVRVPIRPALTRVSRNVARRKGCASRAAY